MAYLGLELLWSSIKDELDSKRDAAVAIIHWILLKNNFKCVDKTNKEQNAATGEGSEFLPKGWNVNQEVYTFHYKYGKEDNELLVKLLAAEDMLLFNAYNNETEALSSVPLCVDHVKDDYKNYSSDLFKSLDKLIKDVETEVLVKVIPSLKKEKPESKRQTDAREFNDNLLWHGVPAPSRGSIPNPFSVGRSDLDPFDPDGGSGMLMDPRRGPHVEDHFRRPHPLNLPRGAVPPGARFHPIGPFPPGRGFSDFSRIDHDHLPPPGYDDQFM